MQTICDVAWQKAHQVTAGGTTTVIHEYTLASIHFVHKEIFACERAKEQRDTVHWPQKSGVEEQQI